VAVISSPTAAGYGDFCDQLLKNPYGFVFYPKLFEAVMQGEWVESSIIQALDRIFAEEERWDVVVIIRGGGATSDLTGFDTYPLAAACAQFPIPIVTGIGHERDDTVLDMISHTRVKTPTAAAELLIARVLESATRLHQLQERTQTAVTYRLTNERHRLEKLADKVPSLFTVYKLNAEHRLARFEQRWRQASERRLTEEEHRWVRLNERLLQAAQRRVVNEQHRLELLQKEVEHASPERLLKRGYSITLKGNKAVTDASQLREGDVLETRFAQGSVRSVVTPEQNRNAK
jgi:exodeoxyribonuclease VII large subunit